MASQNNIINLLFKKTLGYPNTAPTGPYYTEKNFDSREKILQHQIYSTGISHTAFTPGSLSTYSPTGYVSQLTNGTLYYKQILLTSILSGVSYYVSSGKKPVIPPSYDPNGSYNIIVNCSYNNDNTLVQIAQTDATYPWVFDTDSGILTFYNIIPYDNVFISFYTYQGGTGMLSAQAGGYTGAIGYTGATGSLGCTGFTGQTGSQGFSGQTGVQGFQGVTGPIGYTGQTGQQGISQTGLTGYTGYTGHYGTPSQVGVSSLTNTDNNIILTSAVPNKWIASLNNVLTVEYVIPNISNVGTVVLGDQLSSALKVNVGTQYNTLIGLKNSEYLNSGSGITVIGNNCHNYIDTGEYNTVIGYNSLFNQTTGTYFIGSNIVIGNNSFNNYSSVGKIKGGTLTYAADCGHIVLGHNVNPPAGTTGWFVVGSNINTISIGNPLYGGIYGSLTGIFLGNSISAPYFMIGGAEGNLNLPLGKNSISIGGKCSFTAQQLTSVTNNVINNLIIGISNIVGLPGLTPSISVLTKYNSVIGSNNVCGWTVRNGYGSYTNSQTSNGITSNTIFGNSNQFYFGTGCVFFGNNLTARNNVINNSTFVGNNCVYTQSASVYPSNSVVLNPSSTGTLPTSSNNFYINPTDITNMTSYITNGSGNLLVTGINFGNNANAANVTTTVLSYSASTSGLIFGKGIHDQGSVIYFYLPLYFQRIGNTVWLTINLTNFQNFTRTTFLNDIFWCEISNNVGSFVDPSSPFSIVNNTNTCPGRFREYNMVGTSAIINMYYYDTQFVQVGFEPYYVYITNTNYKTYYENNTFSILNLNPPAIMFVPQYYSSVTNGFMRPTSAKYFTF